MFKVGKNWITLKNNYDLLNHKVSYKADLTVNLYCVNYMYMYVICSGMCICSLKVKVLVAQLCPTFCNPMDSSLPGSSVHGILQAKILEWVANLFSKGSFQPRDQIPVSCSIGGLFTISVTGEAHSRNKGLKEFILGWLKTLTSLPHCSEANHP